MHGFITTRHLLRHAPLIVDEFGWRAYVRCIVQCVFSKRPKTFLGLMGRSFHAQA